MDNMNNNVPPQTPNPTPVQSPLPPTAPMREPQSSSTSSFVALLVILALLVAGAVYFWGERGSSPSTESNEELESINAQSESDATLDIEADLDATDIDSVDYDLDEANFNAS